MKILIYILPILLFASCITNKEITYLQYGDEFDKTHISTDTIVRSYDINKIDYTIKADDRLDIKIASLTPQEYNPFAIQDPYLIEARIGSTSTGREVTKGYVVKQDGYIELPMIGELYVRELTIDQLSDTIQVRAKDYLKSPVVKVGLLNFQFSVLSEDINRLLTTDNRTLTILQAIAMSGAKGEFIDMAKVKLVRTSNTKTEVLYLNLLDEKVLQSPYYFIHPNDIIVLAPLDQRAVVKYFGRNVGTFASIATALVSVASLIITITK